MPSSTSEPVALLFEPQRLGQARRLRGLLKTELAQAVGVTPSAISQFESGDAKPSSGTLRKLSLALSVPINFFGRGRGIFHVAEGDANFRSLRATTKRERAQASTQVEMLAEVVDLVERYLELPGVNVPDSLAALDPEDAADVTRAEWQLGLGPISDVVGVLERHGVVVARLSAASDRVDAFSCWIRRRPYVLLASNKETADRSRFDAAHELGHLVLHPDASPGLGPAEVEAHRFASAFLMPRVAIRSELPRTLDFNVLLNLKLRWGVSLQALVRRGFDLGTYTERTYRRAYQMISKRGWRHDEPGDLGPAEQPQLLQRAIEMLTLRYGNGMELLAKRTELPGDELHSLLSMLRRRERPVTLSETDDTLRRSLVRKLDPARFTGMSGRMAAIVGYVLDEAYTDPRLVEMTVTSDGFVLGVTEGEVGANDLLGEEADLNRNLVGLLNATPDITQDELALFGRLQRERIQRW